MEIQSYEFGKIIIDGKEYTKDLIILPDRIVTGWWREEGHSLSIEDLKEVLGSGVRKLIVGTGHDGMMRIPETTIQALRDKGIEVDAASTREAVRYYEESDKKQTALAMHLTC